MLFIWICQTRQNTPAIAYVTLLRWCWLRCDVYGWKLSYISKKGVGESPNNRVNVAKEYIHQTMLQEIVLSLFPIIFELHNQLFFASMKMNIFLVSTDLFFWQISPKCQYFRMIGKTHFYCQRRCSMRQKEKFFWAKNRRNDTDFGIFTEGLVVLKWAHQQRILLVWLVVL